AGDAVAGVVDARALDAELVARAVHVVAGAGREAPGLAGLLVAALGVAGHERQAGPVPAELAGAAGDPQAGALGEAAGHALAVDAGLVGGALDALAGVDERHALHAAGVAGGA